MPHPICLLSLPRLVLLLVSHLVGRLVALVLYSVCFSCVFFVSFSGGVRLLDLSPRPSRPVVSSRRLVVPSRRASRAVAEFVMCLLDLSPMAFSPRRAERGARRGVPAMFRNLFHVIFMNSASIAVHIRVPI